MKFLRTIGIALVLFLLPALAAADGLGNARLSLIEGDVQIQPGDTPDWIPASINMPLREGDRIWVPDRGRAEVQLSGGSQVRIDEGSSLEILNLGNDSSQFYLSAGSAYVNFTAERQRFLQIDTPISSLRVYDPAKFGVDAEDSGMTDLSVYRGSVNAESGSGRTLVREGRMLSIGEGYADIAPLGRSDEWERWNMDRDRRFEDRRYVSTQYLPNELDAYSRDFDDYGRWVNAPGYGPVWTPTVSVSAGWSPYRNGRWCWIGGDYVWVGYEPWGWAPYHYGRWAYAGSIGWFWVPPARGAVYWGPGFVGWVSTPTYVAWVPLAPGETYYGHGNYGPNSVNITNVNVNTIVVKNVYKNVNVNNGVTVVHHDTFVKGKHLDYKPDRNPFLKDKVHVGRPDIKPERETRMPVMRDVPRDKQPPQRVRDVQVKQLREKRPMVKEKDRSVFSPREPEKQMKVKTLDAPQERKRFKGDERRGEDERRGMPEGRPQQENGKGRPAERDKRTGPQEKQRPERQAPPKPDQREMQRGKPDQERDRNGRVPTGPAPERKEQRPGQQDMRPDRQQPPDQRERPQQKREPGPDRQMQQENQRGRNGERAPQKEQREMKPDRQQPSEQRMMERPQNGRGPAQDRQMQQENQRGRNGERAPQKQPQPEKPEKKDDEKKNGEREDGGPQGGGEQGGRNGR